MFDLNDNFKIGIFLVVLSFIIGGIGFTLFLDRALLSMSNLLFIIGLIMLIGIEKALTFFTRKDKLKGTLAYILGIVVVIYGYSLIGIILEVIGMWFLFSAFLPQVVSSIKASPAGFILEFPGFVQVAKWINDQRGLPK